MMRLEEDPAVQAWAAAIEAKHRRENGGRGIEEPLREQLDAILDLMLSRHRKYGPGNIAEFGELGILVRMGDKFARLKAGREKFDDETVSNTLDDIIGYALIWKLWLNGEWPGSSGQ